MTKYIIRRVLYMIPTVFGVILITFILFNVAGGSPAMLKLGKQATAKSLEDYEVQRGYDKPLVCGFYGKTRAFGVMGFEKTIDAWKKDGATSFEKQRKDLIVLDKAGDYEIPIAFDLYPETTYRWKFNCKLSDDGKGCVEIVNDGNIIQSLALNSTDLMGKVRLDFSTGSDTSHLKFRFKLDSGTLEIASISLGKRVRNFFDSQFVFYLHQIARMDFGKSSETNQKVSRMIKDGAIPSLSLMVPMFLIGVTLSISLSLICAFLRDSFIDKFFVVFSVVLMSVNYLIWIILGQYILGYEFRWFPVWGYESWKFIVLPCLIGVLSGLGANLRFYRTVMLDEVYRDYVRTAFAKGLSKRVVLFKHVLKNAMIPIITSVVMAIPFLVTGSLLLETFFGIPGLGTMTINAINNSDFDVIKAVVFIGAMLYVVANLLTDICYTLVDPRVRLR